jgi:hypothetical protein
MPVGGAWRAHDREQPEVEPVGADRRAAGGDEPVGEPPAAELLDSRVVYDVR